MPQVTASNRIEIRCLDRTSALLLGTCAIYSLYPVYPEALWHRTFDPRRDMRCPTYQNPSTQLDDTAGAFTSRVRTDPRALAPDLGRFYGICRYWAWWDQKRPKLRKVPCSMIDLHARHMPQVTASNRIEIRCLDRTSALLLGTCAIYSLLYSALTSLMLSNSI